MRFVENLNHLMNLKGWRNADLARRINLSDQQVGKYVSGKNEPKIDKLGLFGKAFNVSIDDLLFTDLTQEPGRPFGEGVERIQDADAQTQELNRLLRLRVAELEREILALDPDRARVLGIEGGE